MCLNIRQKEKVQIAEKNIPCYKHLNSRNRTVAQYHHYTRFKRNPKVYFGIQNNAARRVNEGYHSRMLVNSETKSHLFIIPKGSEFYEGRENSSSLELGLDGYVSNRIIFIGKNNWFNRWIGKTFYNVEFFPES